MLPDPNARLRALVDNLTGQLDRGAGTESARRHPAPSPASTTVDPKIAPGSIACWWHGTAIQIGVVQNVAADGRVWLRRLDQPRTAVPQPASAISLVLSLSRIQRLAAESLR